MSVTIDHLRVEHRVTVLCDFKDLAGVELRAGERGVLRGLGMDYARMEIWIDLERDSARDTLRFALRAADGPRNGHMREYFEMGDEVADISVNTTQAANEPRESQSPREEPTRPASGVPRFSGRQQPHDTNIEQLSVACACDPLFHRPLLSARGEYSVHACLRCGTVTCTRSLGDDGRFSGDAWHINRTIGLSDQALDWLAHVPRIKVDYTAASARWPMAAELVRYSTLYYPADTRCSTLEELGDLEASLQRQQSGRSVADWLRATCRITNSPPSDLGSVIRGYGDLWESLQLRANSEVRDLLRLAHPGRLGSALATDLLLRRADAFDLMISALRSDDGAQQRAGFSMARDMKPVDPRLSDVLIDMLGALSLEPSLSGNGRVASWAKYEMVFLIAAEARVSTPRLLATLRALMRKLARHDASLVDYVRIVIRELDPPSQPR
ncbi:MAG: hypothetical protein ABMA00_04010 [Gemmatimonas sp.]